MPARQCTLQIIILFQLLPQLPAGESALLAAVPITRPPLWGAPSAHASWGAEKRSERQGMRQPRMLALRGGGGARRDLRRRSKDPPLFGPTELMDMMTRGKYSRDLALFERSLENDGLVSAAEELQLKDAAQRGMSNTERAESEEEDEEDEEDGVEDGDDEAAASGDALYHNPAAAAQASADVDDDMDDNLYIWSPDGSVRSA